jgi:predicted GNAT superfamily acetyltransferase
MTAEVETMVSIRDIEGIAEMREVEELQKEVWGMGDREVVPVMNLIAVKESGGALIGAFDGDKLVGFAYGFGGCEHGRMSLHSHMAAVKSQYRNFNLGYRLKLAQRDHALDKGLTLMTWTFDPLQSLNAHFNFSKLGVVSDSYRINFYGDATSSYLHRTGTDRLWVSWLLDSQRVKQRLESPAQSESSEALRSGLTPLVKVNADGAPERSELASGLAREYALIEIPADIVALQQRCPELGVEWREATREAFTAAINAGFLIEEFHRRSNSGQAGGVYLLRAGGKLSDFI